MPDISTFNRSSPNPGSSMIHNFWCANWFCDFISDYLELTEPTEL